MNKEFKLVMTNPLKCALERQNRMPVSRTPTPFVWLVGWLVGWLVSWLFFSRISEPGWDFSISHHLGISRDTNGAEDKPRLLKNETDVFFFWGGGAIYKCFFFSGPLVSVQSSSTPERFVTWGFSVFCALNATRGNRDLSDPPFRQCTGVLLRSRAHQVSSNTACHSS